MVTVAEDRCSHVNSITLVLPAYNEQAGIAEAIREADEALAELTSDYEILVVDDGSRDATAAIAEGESLARRNVRVLRQPRNLGYGAALRRGFQAATKSWVAFTDADCQFHVRELDRLILLAEKCDIACGYRIDRQDPWRRKFYSRVYNAMAGLLLGTGVRDCDCAFKMARREVFQSIPIESDGFSVNSELLARARMSGKSIVEVGVTHRPRVRGQSTVSFLHSIPVATWLLRFWWQTILFPRTSEEVRAGVNSSSVNSSSIDLLSSNSSSTEARSVGAWSGPVEFGAALLLCLIGLVVMLGNLSYPLFEPDESRYAQIAQEMIASGDWVTPTLEGKPYLDKPPLLYWLTALSFKTFGAGEMAARLPCAVSALLTVFALYALGRSLVGARAAWCGAVLLLLCGGFVLSGRFLLMDSLLTLFTTVSMLCMYEAQRDPRSRVGWWLISGIACGLGVLAKGPIAVVLCVPPLVAARWLDESSRAVRVRHWVAFGAPIFLLAIPWFVAISAVQTEFSGYFFWKHHIVRFFNAFDHRQPWWFYLPVGLAGMFPASLLFPFLARFLFSRSPVERSMRARELGYLMLAAAWILGLFSMSSCKLPSYILPAMPPLCLLLGSMLDVSVLQRGVSSRFSDALQRVPRHAVAAVLFVAIVGGVADMILVREGGLRLMLDLSIVIGAGWMLVVVSRVSQLQTYVAWAGAAAITVALNVYVFDVSLPGMSRLRSISLAAARLHESNQFAPVVYFDRISYSASLHLKQDELFSLRADQLSKLAEFTRRFPSVVVVTTGDGEKTIRRGLGSSIELKPSGTRSGVYLARHGSASIETAANRRRLSKR